ncbi:MAG: Nif3-like dinuclear metal center hexameric protein [Gemmatimonadota bacterium]
MRLDDLVRYLDDYLRVREIADAPNALNGLQVENAGHVRQIAAAVDACQATIDAAAERGADLLLVHHGLFWGGLEPLTGRTYRRAAALVRHGIAVYACHLPLDRHPEVGNNAVLARKLGMDVCGWFGDYLGAPLGTWGEVDLAREVLRDALGAVLGVPVRLIPGGPARSRRVGIITGAAGSQIRQAHEAGLDTFITGEGQHWTYFDAEELGVNVLYGGHYATEIHGVQALAAHLAERFQLPWSFIDHPTGL